MSVAPAAVTRLRASRIALRFAVLTALMLLLLVAADPGGARAATCQQTDMDIVAHQDDDLLFMSPDLLENIAAGDCVRTVYVTAGDAGQSATYWHEREAGSRAAYAEMAGVADSWTASTPVVAGHTVHMFTLVGKPGISQVYLRLPDGGYTGSGFAATGFQSVPELWRSRHAEPAGLSAISEISAIDGSATYTYEGLLGTLEGLIKEFGPGVIGVQDFAQSFGGGDHADHIAVAKFAQLASLADSAPHRLRSFVDYETRKWGQNVFEPQLKKKLAAYFAYAPHDSGEACVSQAECESKLPSYWQWLQRRYVASETRVSSSGDLALNHTATSSSTEETGFDAAKADDGNPSTRWSSAYTDNQWWQVDLGSAQQVDEVKVNWEAAYGSRYLIQTSTDGTTFTQAAEVTNTGAGVKTTTFAARSARYVRIQGVKRGSAWGYSFWSAEVFGPGSS